MSLFELRDSESLTSAQPVDWSSDVELISQVTGWAEDLQQRSRRVIEAARTMVRDARNQSALSEQRERNALVLVSDMRLRLDEAETLIRSLRQELNDVEQRASDAEALLVRSRHYLSRWCQMLPQEQSRRSDAFELDGPHDDLPPIT